MGSQFTDQKALALIRDSPREKLMELSERVLCQSILGGAYGMSKLSEDPALRLFSDTMDAVVTDDGDTLLRSVSCV